MKDNVIYYPYTHVPNNSSWFNQIVLYWDDVYSINPHGKSFKPYMQKLIDYKLVKAINLPSDIDTSIDYDNFLEYVDNPKYPVPHDINLVNWDNAEKLFHQKFDENELIAKGLIERGLAKKHHIDYKIEPYTANLYMLFLAGVIGKNKEYEATPITNTQSKLSYNDPSSHLRKNSSINKNHYTILEDIFPVPCAKEVIKTESISKFKNKNYELLSNFRKYVESGIIKIENTKNPDKRKDKEERFKIESELIKKDISEKMKANEWKNIIRKNWWMFGLHTAILGISFITKDTSGYELLHASELAGESILKSINKIKKDKKLRQNPLAYAVVASKNFTLKDCNPSTSSVSW